MKKSGLLVLILGLSLSLFAGEKTDAMLFGDVKSKVTGEHIPYANIIVKGTNMGTAADGTGHFKLANLPVGKCIIIAHAIGYKSQEKEVVMERGKG
jgi:outer membrane receptor for ferrienterochelin and colicins